MLEVLDDQSVVIVLVFFIPLAVTITATSNVAGTVAVAGAIFIGARVGKLKIGSINPRPC